MKYLLTLFCIVATAATVFAADGKQVTYQVDGQDFSGYYISPKDNAPLVLMIHDWDGLTDYEVKRAGMLAELGYAVFALDLFGSGVRPAEVQERRKLTGTLYADRDKMRRLMNGALAFAESLGANVNNAVAVGYCFGGASVLEWARSGVPLKGFVSFHGGLTTPEGQDYSKTTGSILILHGTADASVSMEDFANLAQELEASGRDHEMITYSGAQHAFSVFGGKRYQAEADKKSWKRFTEYLQEVL